MLEKNKDYIEMRVSSTDCAFTQNAATQIHMNGFLYTTYFCLPDPGESYVVISKEKFEKLQANAAINAELAKQWEINYNLLLKKTGFDTVEELVFYLTNVVQCDTMQEAIASLQDKLQYTCEEWKDMKKKLEECEKDYISERDKVEVLEQEAKVYSRALQEWKEITGYPSPSAVKTAIEAGASWCHAYNEIKEANKKLGDSIKSWQNVTGYSTPEDYLHARINDATPFDYTAAWQKASGCSTPEQAKSHIEDLEKGIRLMNRNMLKELDSEINEWQKSTGCETPGSAERTLRNLRGKIDEMKEFAAIASNWTDRIVED